MREKWLPMSNRELAFTLDNVQVCHREERQKDDVCVYPRMIRLCVAHKGSPLDQAVAIPTLRHYQHVSHGEGK